MAEAKNTDDIAALFTRDDGTFFCARWSRPIVPVVFGVEQATTSTLKGALEAVVQLAGHKMAETDPEMGANLFYFFFRDWMELAAIPDLDRLVPGIAALIPKMQAQNAARYRAFRFEKDGAIRAGFVFIRVGGEIAKIGAQELALSEAVQMVLTWSEGAFRETSPLGLIEGVAVLRPEIANLIRAAYDPVMPVVSQDAAHALRLKARMEAPK